MSESHSPARHDPTSALDYPSPAGSPVMLRLGGGLGIAGCAVGLLIFLAACAGYRAAFVLSFIPVAFGAIGFVLSVIGGVFEKAKIGIEDTHVLGALFAACMSLIGGLLEMAVWRGWHIFTP